MAGRERVVCCSEQVIERGDAFRFEIERGGQSVPAFVIRWNGTPHAYLNRCAHVAMELDWIPGKLFDAEGMRLICATHGALYDPGTGRCMGGPCGRGGLVAVPVRERDGFILMGETVDEH